MIGYVTIGTNNLEKAKAFYGPFFAELGGRPAWASERMQGYASKAGMVAICTPHDGKAATVGNGAMFRVPCREPRDGGRALCQGDSRSAPPMKARPAARTDNFYGAYFRDPDGEQALRVQGPG